jgi:hypothetical protein
MNMKHTYTSSADVYATCLKRRSAYNIFNKILTTPNESAEFARAQMLQRKGLGGTTIFITLAEETALLASLANNANANANANATASAIAYIEKCPFVYRRRTVLPLTNKF